MSSAYPFYSQVATPTGRSQQTQARINDLATKVFTAYELQKLRAYIPNITFRVEEAKLYQHNILDSDKMLRFKLQPFVAVVYIYDILTNTMRDINERVVNSTKTSLLNTSRAEVAKILNVLRGFLAVERSNSNPEDPVAIGKVNEYVYMTRIPISVLDMIQKIDIADPGDTVKVSKKGLISTKIAAKVIGGKLIQDKTEKDPVAAKDVEAFRVFAPGPLSYGNPDMISVYLNTKNTLPAYNFQQDSKDDSLIGVVDTDKVSSDCLPSALIPLLFKESFTRGDILTFAPKHVSNLMALFHDVPIKTAKEVNFGDFGEEFPNLIVNFIRRDLIAFNRLRSAILNHIDAWWRNAGALALVSKPEKTAPWRNFANLMVADYRVSGIPQPSCGPGTGPVFFNMDPTDPDSAGKLKVVDPYIVASDGSLVENPNAVYGPVCSRSKIQRDLFSGGTGGAYPSMDGGPLPNFHGGEAKRTRRKRHVTSQKKKKTVRRR
eukprot:jgi/Mesvir1/23364/Mv21059-RA.1